MIIAKEVFEQMINSPVRFLRGRVEIFEGSTLALICGCHDRLKSFTVERTGEQGKFFGFGICQRLNTHLLDPNRELNISTANTLEVEFGVGSDYIYPCPNFYVTEVNRDENTNELSITAYDALYRAANHTVSELSLPREYTIRQFAEACAALLGVPMKETDMAAFDTDYPTGANFDGTETIRDALNAVAEATQTIYYIDSNWELTFKRLDVSGEPIATIDKSKYISLDSKTNRRLATIVHATELGDNVSATYSKGTGVAAGKNLLPYPYNETTKTENGITFTDNGDGTITANGTATADVEFNFTAQNPEFDWLVHNKYYYISGAQGVSGINMFTEYIDADGTTQQKKGRIVWKDDYTLKRFLVSITNGTTLENAVIQPMVEQAANPTEYEPYTEKVTSLIGSTQYVRDNPFWELREDIGTIVENAAAAIGGLTINQFDCTWRGNYLLEIGDKIALTTKDDKTVISYILDDTIEFNGSLSGKTKWQYTDNEGETSSNPSSLGEALKQTFARVDKAEKTITMVASETSGNAAAISSLQLTTETIGAQVSNTKTTLDELGSEISTLTSKVNAQITAEDIQIEVTKQITENGVARVETTSGTFDSNGLTVAKEGSEMETTISDNGMVVKKDNSAVLTANNRGVDAVNLHATTYLIIGNNSRFEDYGNKRTACFFIG